MKSSRAVESRNVVGHHHSQKPDDLIITNGSKSLSTKQSGCRLSHVYSHGHFKCSVGWNRNQWVHMDGFLKSSISRWDFRFPLFLPSFLGYPHGKPHMSHTTARFASEARHFILPLLARWRQPAGSAAAWALGLAPGGPGGCGGSEASEGGGNGDDGKASKVHWFYMSRKPAGRLGYS